MNETPDFSRAFESLRAEYESDWLVQAFIPPLEFGIMAGQHSILVIGEEGAGKTALEMQLRAFAAQRAKSCPLVAFWRPQLKEENLSSDQVVDIFLAQSMNSLAFALLQQVAQWPETYQEASSWVQDFIVWFTQFYLQGDREFLLSRLSESTKAAGVETVKKILASDPRSLFSQSTTPSEILSHLTESIRKLGFDGVWIFVEDLDNLFRTSPDRLTQNLKSLLSTLDIFETPTFSIKIIAPSDLGLRLQTARGVKTRRFSVHYLNWQMEELVEIIERRIALVLNKERMPLNEICADKAWLNWLKQHAGNTPRGWLDMSRPVIMAYMKKGGKLSTNEWKEIYRQSPPLLSINLETNQVYVGHGEVTISTIGYKLLRYLYENRHRACSKSELYFCGHKGLPKEPRGKEDDGWEDTPAWEGVLDTALWRLRQSIEWDKKKGGEAMYVVSARGRGQVRLKNTG